MITRIFIIFLALALTNFSALAESGTGIGPVQDLKLEELSEAKAKQGKEIFTAKCSACHKMEERYVGPALKDTFKLRKPEWIANMILNPVEMTQKDPIAQELLAEFLTQMTYQDVSQDQAKLIVEYLRYYSEKGEIAEPKLDKKQETSKNKSKKTK